MCDLRSKNLDELKEVHSFKILNKHAEILFLAPVDLTEVDLADLVTLKRGEVEVYNDERHAGIKPPFG